MSWRDTYRQPSFRGVEFEVPNDDLSSGRRYATHVYPGRDEHLNEDLGLSPTDYSIEALIIGDDFARRRDALEAELKKPGAGKLVHPWLGERSVVALTWSIRHSQQQGRSCRFRISFKDAGANVRPIPGVDSALSIGATAVAAEGTVSDNFITWFDAGEPGDFVEDAAADTYEAQINAFTEEVALSVDTGTEIVDTAISVASNARTLVRDPLSLISTSLPLFGRLIGLGGNVQGSIQRALRFFASSGDNYSPVPLTTSRRRQQASNQLAIVNLFKREAAITEARLVPSITFDTRDEAITTRDSIIANLDQLVLDADPSFDAAPLRQLQADVLANINPRAVELSRISTYRPRQTEPVDVVAYRLYGSTEQSEFVTSRNRIRHPGFAVGGVELEVQADG